MKQKENGKIAETLAMKATNYFILISNYSGFVTIIIIKNILQNQ